MVLHARRKKHAAGDPHHRRFDLDSEPLDAIVRLVGDAPANGGDRGLALSRRLRSELDHLRGLLRRDFRRRDGLAVEKLRRSRQGVKTLRCDGKDELRGIRGTNCPPLSSTHWSWVLIRTWYCEGLVSTTRGKTSEPYLRREASRESRRHLLCSRSSSGKSAPTRSGVGETNGRRSLRARSAVADLDRLRTGGLSKSSDDKGATVDTAGRAALVLLSERRRRRMDR